MAPQQAEQPYVVGEDADGGASDPGRSGAAPGGDRSDGGQDSGSDSGSDSTGTGEIRAAERQAQRAAAIAVAEGFHPLRIRPYVAEAGEPGAEAGEPAVRPLVPADTDGPVAAGAELVPAAYSAYEAYSGFEYPQEEPEAVYPEAEHGRHRRRRRGMVITAAAVAASALAAGAVTVTGQVTDDQRGPSDRALPDRSTSMPDVTLPSDAAPAGGKTASAVTHRALPVTVGLIPSASPSPAASPTAPAAGATPTPAPTTPAATSGTITPQSDTVPSAPPVTTPPPAETPVAPPAPDPLLQLGDTGPAVADLQRRLAALWVYHGRADGDFDHKVADAVATFQEWYAVPGDLPGVYGPATRATLELLTPLA
ncbi:peptidoglycan-binding domain-containing protein [Streptomyces sp.]|uniref:peptidoglycan-binding domain-containing protein n=1 Tax=Streptomyces sp. TaxID=1931 RepID=UPI002F415C2D